jgi:hypothetical protein
MALMNIAVLQPAVTKTIAVRATNAVVLYTVPAAKTFSGFACPNSNIGLALNGITLLSITQSSSATSLSGSQFKLDLTEGDVISCVNYYADWSLVGTEK